MVTTKENMCCHKAKTLKFKKKNPVLSMIIFSNFMLVMCEIEVQQFVDAEKEASLQEWRDSIKPFCGQRKRVLQSHDVYMRVKDLVSGNKRFNNSDFDYFVKLIEDVLMTIHLLTKASTKCDYALAVINFVKLRKAGPVITAHNLDTLNEKFNEIFFGPEIQSEDIFVKARNYMNTYEEVRKAPIFGKLEKFIQYLLATSLFEEAGITFDKFRYSKLEEELFRKNHNNKLDMVANMLSTVLFLCERGQQCMLTGNLDPLFHSSSAYDEWFTKVAKLKLDATVMGNPDPHFVDGFAFLADLEESIEKGESIYKHAMAVGDIEKGIVRNLLNDLKLLKCNETTKRDALKKRACPFSLLIYGGSGVAKSKLTELLFFQYGKLMGLKTESEFMYTRNAADPFWSGFRSFMWCLLMDDVAFMHPNKAMNGDPSIMELIQVVNDISLVPNQADLADKGKTPVKCRFVMATTNAENLNAYAYFSSPLAAQRRLPYIVDVMPKDEYTTDGVTIDQDKLPITADGCYPDFWKITIKKVVPSGAKRNNQTARFELVDIFDNILDFIEWFNAAAIRHDKMQAKSTACTDVMREIELCGECKLPNRMCRCRSLQADTEMTYITRPNGEVIYTPVRRRRNDVSLQTDIGINTDRLNEDQKEEVEMYDAAIAHLEIEKERSFKKSVFDYFYMHAIDFALTCYFEFSIFRWGVSWAYTFPIFQRWLKRCASTKISDSRLLKKFISKLGARVQKRIGNVKILHAIAGFIATGTVILVVMKLVKSYFKSEHDDCVFNGDAYKSYEIEGVNQSKGVFPEKDEHVKVDVWKKQDYTTTTFDVNPINTSYLGLDVSKVRDALLRNCVTFRSYTGEFKLVDGVEVAVVRPNRAVCVAGHVYMCNNHGLPELGSFEMDVISSTLDSGVNSNLKITVSHKNIQRFPQYDLAFVLIRNIPPRKDIRKLFCKKTLDGVLEGDYIAKKPNGSIYCNKIRNITRLKIPSVLGCIDSWRGYASEDTQNGDCGSLLLANSAYGPIVLGIHYLGGPDGEVVAVVVTDDMVEEGIVSLQEIIVSDSVPLLSAPSARRGLIELNHNSAVRYIPQGTANVYGSFSGFRPKMKSRVEPTYINARLRMLGYKEKTGPPDMSWKPWNLALNAMVKPVTQLDNAILQDCVKAYSDDILEGLSTDELHNIQVYNTFTAINGAAGVNYVDKINRNTSAGCPWKKSKKYFMNAIDPVYDLLDPVEISSEILDRVDLCISRYIDGYRYSPVFCGSLKDQAVTFPKVKLGKTRVFTGAPLDWTITVRKYLLSFIRVAQNNKYLFESAPGMVAQSTEWEKLMKYLIVYGDDRIVAGDYKNFDKSMASTMILACFDVIYNICKAAGYTSEDLKVIMGIATDTAFPFVDLNGDLIECYGSNPSGHPLTVTINGIANCLYMRYCYFVLNPARECVTFKQSVNLMVYGDDNAMGVHRDAEWFNHTAIQKVLERVGISYTMADKVAVSVPFINIRDTNFLKRSWRLDKDVGAYLCPLEHDSIENMLMTNVTSKTIPRAAQSVEIMSTAVREYFFYGKCTFLEKRKMLMGLVDENLAPYVKESTFPTWNKLKEDFWTNSI